MTNTHTQSHTPSLFNGSAEGTSKRFSPSTDAVGVPDYLSRSQPIVPTVAEVRCLSRDSDRNFNQQGEKEDVQLLYPVEYDTVDIIPVLAAIVLFCCSVGSKCFNTQRTWQRHRHRPLRT